MLDLCASVGADAVDVTWTTNTGQPRRFDENVRLADFAGTLPATLDNATRQQRNVIIRPHGPEVTLLQLDDLDQAKLARVAEVAFVILKTSPGRDGTGNHQAWLALPGITAASFAAGSGRAAARTSEPAGQRAFRGASISNRITRRKRRAGRTIHA